jgi:hypothetical protein
MSKLTDDRYSKTSSVEPKIWALLFSPPQLYPRVFLRKAAAFLRQSVGGVPPLKGTAVPKDNSALMS